MERNNWFGMERIIICCFAATLTNIFASYAWSNIHMEREREREREIERERERKRVRKQERWIDGKMKKGKWCKISRTKH